MPEFCFFFPLRGVCAPPTTTLHHWRRAVVFCFREPNGRSRRTITNFSGVNGSRLGIVWRATDRLEPRSTGGPNWWVSTTGNGNLHILSAYICGIVLHHYVLRVVLFLFASSFSLLGLAKLASNGQHWWLLLLNMLFFLLSALECLNAVSYLLALTQISCLICTIYSMMQNQSKSPRLTMRMRYGR